MNIKNKTRMVNLSDLKPYKNNAKKHPDYQVQQLKKSIEENDYIQPIIVDDKDVIVSGHGRYLALNEIDSKQKVEVVDVSYLKPKQIKKLRILDNKIVSNDYDVDILQAEIDSLYGSFDDIDKIADELNVDLSDIDVPSFDPATEDEQGQLDQKKPTECPECGHKWII